LKKSFLKKFSVTAIGSLVALIIPLISSPIIGRLYTPEEFASLSLFISTIGLLSIISSGQIQNSLFDPLVRRNYSIQELWSRYSSYTIFWAINFTIIYILLKYYIRVEMLGPITFLNWALIIIGLFFTNFNAFLNPLIIIDEKFEVNSRNKVLTSFTVSSVQLGLSQLWNKLGLILGNIAGLIVSNYNFSKAINFSYKRFKPKSPLKIFTDFKNYTLYYTSSSLVGQLNNYAPIFFLPVMYGMTSLGQYAFGMKLFQIPLNIFSKSIQEVFKQESSSEMIEFGNCKKSFKKSLLALISISLLPFLVFSFTIEYIMPYVFGAQWEVAGTILKLLSPALFLKFITSPLSFVFILRKKQKIDLALQLTVGLTISILFLAGKSIGFLEIIKLLNLIYCMLYGTYLFLSFQYSK